LGNPGAFRRTLAGLGVEVERFVVFPDHHKYTAAEIGELRRSGEVLVTTEKDAVKLEGLGEGIWWLETGMEIRSERAVGPEGYRPIPASARDLVRP
ncbi:MAG: tetraacyldisaccharide 4'-kinase, partial [Bryobacteraceae bacterium]|nr:tetraacyldisaccharide 4'-kinase [Bryobacteraceae bacterium]